MIPVPTIYDMISMGALASIIGYLRVLDIKISEMKK